jgi:hypothetical protein
MTRERYRAQMQTPDVLAVWAITGETERRMIVAGPWLKPGATVEVVPRDQLAGAVEAERKRIAALVRDKAEGTWDPTVEAVLRALVEQITAGGQ